MKPKAERKPKFFKTHENLREWFSKYHDVKSELWIGFYKKSSGKNGATYPQALDEALCIGWIDGLLNRVDENSYMVRFTPRGKKSIWSKKNTEHVGRLIKSREMKPSGLEQVRLAQADGRWAAAYDSQANATAPADFLQRLNRNKKATAFFATLERRNSYAIIFRLQNTKNEAIRARKIEEFVAMLAKGEKFHR